MGSLERLYATLATLVIWCLLGLGLMLVGLGETPFIWEGFSVTVLGIVIFVGMSLHYVPQVIKLFRGLRWK